MEWKWLLRVIPLRLLLMPARDQSNWDERIHKTKADGEITKAYNHI